MNSIIKKLIACPLCKGNLFYSKESQRLICRLDYLYYPLNYGVMFLLKSKAISFSKNEIN